MPAKLIEQTPAAYAYPLLIKHLLHGPLAHSPDQEIVYRDLVRYTYRDFARRLGQRAGEHRGQAGRHGGGHGLGQPPLPRVLLRGAHDGGDPAYSERAPVA